MSARGKVRGGKRWIDEHVSDPFVQRARSEGYRSRAAYKLIEIDDRDHLLGRGKVVVDLGAAPGSWTVVVARRVGATTGSGRIIAVDLLVVAPIAGVTTIQGDFAEATVLEQVRTALAGRPVDLVLSDMAPNISGISVSDQARGMALAELALDFAVGHLKPGGAFLVKMFQGEGFVELIRAMRGPFEQVITRKPAASRDRSSETFVLARGFRETLRGGPEN